MTDQQKLPLQIITYLVPSMSVELFEAIAQYLESSLGRETTLVYESRFIGPQPARIDPFKTKTADLGNYFLYLISFIYTSQRLLKHDSFDYD